VDVDRDADDPGTASSTIHAAHLGSGREREVVSTSGGHPSLHKDSGGGKEL
jgi:hypothetical protein